MFTLTVPGHSFYGPTSSDNLDDLFPAAFDWHEYNGRAVRIMNERDELIYETDMRWESPVPRPTAEPELVENIMRLLDIKDLVRETRPAYRARIQHLKSHRYEVEAMTPDQAMALFHVLDKLPYDDSIDYMVWIDAFDVRIHDSGYVERCAWVLADAAVDALNELGEDEGLRLMSTTY